MRSLNRWGVEVAIFRGNNRNRRRGFHNTHVFYQLLSRLENMQQISWPNIGGVPTKTRQLELFSSAT